MFRSLFRPPALLCAALAVFGLASAQGNNVTVPVRAIISYANLLTPELVAELQADHGEAPDLAAALVERHLAEATICPATASAARLALASGLLPRDTFVFYLADMLNGEACAPTNLEVALAQLAEANVPVPLADSEGYITSDTLADALTDPETQVISGTQPGSDDSYNDPISGTAGQ